MSSNGGAIAWSLAIVLLDASTRVREVIRLCRELVEWRGIPIPGVLLTLAEAHALDADFSQARSVVDQAAEIYRDWGHYRGPIYIAYTRGRVELLFGDAIAAERRARHGLEMGASVGGDEYDGANALILAQALCQQRRFDEADDVAATYAGVTSPLDIGRVAAWDGVRAEILVHHEQWSEAVNVARQAIIAVDQTDLFSLRADLRLPLALALRGCRDRDAADRTAAEALCLYEAKGHRAGAEKAAALRASHP